MLRTDYYAVKALAEFRLQEIERQAETRRALRDLGLAPPERLPSLRGWLGTLLVRVGQRLEAYQLRQALPLEQA